MSDQYIPGDGCECGAWNESECGCGVDWTPKRQKELESEVTEQARLLGMSSEREAALQAKIRRLQAQLHAAIWIIEKQKQSMNEPTDLWELTDQWIAAVRERYKDQKRGHLTQVFMRGPFAGWSERQLAQFADDMHEKNSKYPIHKQNNEQ